MAETPNHGYNVPDKGTQNWHEPLNGNFEAFEVDIELRDVGAPGANGYDPTDGAKYLDTTTGEVYLADGSSWSQEFSFGSGGGGISSLTGGDGIDPTDIGDSDTLSVLWGDAAGLDSTGTPDEFSNAGDLSSDGSIDALSGGLAPSGKTVENIAGDNLSISNGQLNAAGGSGGATDLTGGDGIDPTDIGDGDIVSVAWGDAADLASGGTVNQLSGSLTGGNTLTDITGDNLSITNGTLNASGGGGSGTSLTGGNGIDPGSIENGDTLSVAWSDGTDLASGGTVNQLSGSLSGGNTLTDITGNNLSITNGTLNASGSGGGTSLTGGDGINPGSIEDGDTLSVAWDDADGLDTNGALRFGTASDLDSSGNVTDFGTASDLDSSGSVDQLSGSLTGNNTLTNIAGGNLSIDGQGNLNASAGQGGGITGLSGGDGIGPESIDDGNTVFVDAGTYLGFDSSDRLTVSVGSGLGNDGSGNLQASLGNALGFDNSNQIEVATDSITVAGNSVSLGGSTGISHSNLGGVSADQHHARNHDHTESGISTVPNGGLANSSVTVNAGNALQGAGSVSLGGSTTLDVGSGRYIATSSDQVDFNGPAEWENSGSTATNTASGTAATVAGGERHEATADWATVGGGDDNIASGEEATISGGFDNDAIAQHAVIGGGERNTAGGSSATVGGGENNVAGAAYATIAGGGPSDPDNSPGTTNNEVFDNYGTIGGGGNNQAGSDDSDSTTAQYATVGGGNSNTASAQHAAVGGGQGNNATDKKATVGGGQNNTATSTGAVVAGGSNNEASGSDATVAGGFSNQASGSDASIIGGRDNTATEAAATVGGGRNNEASGEGATVAGGGSDLLDVGNTASGTASTVGGGENNVAGAAYATIAGGGPSDTSSRDTTNNVVYDDYGTIGGGGNNQAGSDDSPQDPTNATYAAVGGGFENTANNSNTTIGGGSNNTASGKNATVAGGINNTASGFDATVGGGFQNTANGIQATVPGGGMNEASGSNAFAAGRKAKARASGAFVWGDNSSTAVESTTQNEVVFQADGGVTLWSDSGFNSGVELNSGGGSWNSLSARASKTNVEPIDPRDVLAGVEKMSVSTWEYETNEGVTHMGPMAGQFHETFGLGDDPERISTVDADGVALAAVQGLSAELDDAHEEIAQKDDRIEEQADRIDEQTDRIDELEAENEHLRERLAALEEHLGLNSGANLGVADD